MLNKIIENFIRQHDLLRKDGKHLIALSGGADSVSLLLILKSLEYHIEAVHCNFHLRGEESERDEKFCVDLCKRQNIPLHLVHFDTKTYAQHHKVSIEMAARELRYDYFEQLRKDLGADDICVAHHRDDCVETILLNLIRGTGIQGLTGIAPKNGYVIRPLLCVSRSDLVDYLNSIKQNYVTDSTNLIDDVQRNKIRLDVIPLLKKINPAAVDNIYQSSLYLTEAQKMAVYAVKDGLLEGKRLPFTKLIDKPSPEFALWYVLKDYHFTSAQIEEMADSLHSQSGKEWFSDTHIIVKDRDCFILEPLESKDFSALKIIEEGNYVFDEQGKKIKVKSFLRDKDFKISKEKNCVMLDADLVKFPLTLRKYEKGDRFVPFGMKGSRLVSDFLTDLKKTILEKRHQLVVTDCEANILWVVNERPDNRYRITAKTQKILSLQMD
jgi:tRNA(Ile)-lysidine synthase